MRAYPVQRKQYTATVVLLVLCACSQGLRGRTGPGGSGVQPSGFSQPDYAEEVGTKVNTLVPALFKDGYAFGYGMLEVNA